MQNIIKNIENMFFQIQMQIFMITNSHNTLQLDRTATQLIRIHPNGDDSN